jgi:pilus assembly protein FimV
MECESMPRRMRLNTRPQSVMFKLSLQTLSAAVLSTLLFAQASAAGLGKLTVNSALGQPLHAEIELTSVSSDEAGQLVPKLASTDAFRQANIDFNPALLSLRFAVVQRDGKQYITVTSTQPINDPFVDMLLELGGNGSGRLVREYTFLLDPVDLHTAQAPQVSGVHLPPLVVNGSQTAVAPVQSQPAPIVTERPAQTFRTPRAPVERPPKPVASQPTAEKSAPQQGDYRVKSGDSLSKIAGQLKPDGISLDQMLVAMFRANQGAFVGNNMNRLRAGQVLSVPDASSVGAVSNGEARGIVVAQAADFNDYRNKLAGQVVNSEPQKSTETRQSASGKITAKVEEKSTVAAESKDKLKLSKAGAPVNDKGGKIVPGEEDRIAKEKAIAESAARVKELEKNVNDLQKILEIKNKNIADQQKADAAKAAAKPAVVAAVAPVVTVPPVAPKPVAKPVPETVVPPVVAAAPSKPPKPKLKPIAPPPPPETSFLDDLLGNPFALGGIAFILVGAGAFGIYSGYRKRKEKSFGDSIITDSSLKANSLFGSTGGQSVDTNNSVFNSNFVPSTSQLDSNEVDPVAEADVYIAYGRDAQAEEILKEALRTQPERNAVRVKLLEIYANRKDLRSFEVLATELYDITKGEGEDWQQAASLGMSLDPKNPLYGAGSALIEGLTGISASSEFAQPLDELNLDDLVPNPDTHTRPSLKSPNTLDESLSFASTTLARDDEPDTVARPPLDDDGARVHNASTSLDFDLDGIDTEHIEIPEAAEHVAPPTAHDNKMDFGNIDFDFLKDEAPAQPIEPVHHVEDAITHHIDLAQEIPAQAVPVPHMEFEVPSLPEVPMIALDDVPVHPSAPAPAPAPASLDFDLSGITLELNPSDNHLAPAHSTNDHATHSADLHMPDSHAVNEIESPQFEPLSSLPPDLLPPMLAESDVELDTGIDHEYSNNAEMATKLDLALAYQEIGDKEGARELLDEVVGGGTPEQAETAKSLLAKLG